MRASKLAVRTRVQDGQQELNAPNDVMSSAKLKFAGYGSTAVVVRLSLSCQFLTRVAFLVLYGRTQRQQAVSHAKIALCL